MSTNLLKELEARILVLRLPGSQTEIECVKWSDLCMALLRIGSETDTKIKNLRQRFLEELPMEGEGARSDYQNGWNAAAKLAHGVLDVLIPGPSK
jgi:hypothetical protein